MSADKEKGISTEVESRLDDLFGDGKKAGEFQEDKTTAAEVSSRLDELFNSEQPPSQASKSASGISKQEKKTPPAPVKPEGNKSLLGELKSIILSLEWEITDQLMLKLEEELKVLEDKCKEDKIVTGFVQLMNSLGKYIRKKKAEAHPDSVVLLRSVFDSMEKCVESSDLSEVSKKKMLVVELNKYKELKSQLLVKPDSSKKAEPKPSDEDSIQRPPPEEALPRRSTFEEPSPPVAEIPPFSLAEQEQVVVVETPESFTYEKSNETATPVAVTMQEVVRALDELRYTIQTEMRALISELQLWREQR